MGHTSLESTQIYTQVSMKHLKEVHERTHPSALRGPAATIGELSGRTPHAHVDAAELADAVDDDELASDDELGGNDGNEPPPSL